MPRSFLVVIPLLAVSLAHASGVRPLDARNTWQVRGGEVRAIQLVGSTVYIGGSFDRIVPPTGSAVPFDLRTGAPRPGFASFQPGVFAIVPDGVGGWYVGGQFFMTMGQRLIMNLAHVRADLSVVDWDVARLPMVTALALHGNRLYVGGSGFVTAVDPATGRQLPWLANTDGQVTAIHPAGDRVFVGGNLMTIDSHLIYGLAALDAQSAAVLDWNPAQGLGAATNARALVVVGNTIYVGGSFDGKLSGVPRRNLAAIDIPTGTILPWNPDPDGLVTSLAVDHGRMYVGGDFQTIGGRRRSRLAMIDLATGAPLRWAPVLDGGVSSICFSGSRLYAVGSFATVDRAPHPRAVAFDLATGRPASWRLPELEAAPRCAAVGRGALYVGAEDALGVGAVVRRGTAALNALTGEPTAWDPGVANVHAMLVDDDVVYIGGGFTDVGGIRQKCLTAVDRTTGRLLPWSPEPDGGVDALVSNGRTLYVGGDFTQIAGRRRGAGAAFSLSNRRLLDWDPGIRSGDVVGTVYALLPAADRIYLGGSFSAVGGAARTDVAAVDALRGAPLAWNPVTVRTPGSPGGVYALAKSGSSVFAGGLFDFVDGVYRPYLAELDAESGVLLPLDIDPNDFVFGLHVDDGILYAAGFTSPMAIDLATRQSLRWAASACGRVITIVSANGLTYVGSTGGLFIFDSAKRPAATVQPATGTTTPALAVMRRGPASLALSFTMPSAGTSRLAIYDIAGRQVARLADDVLAQGAHEVLWETGASGVPPGIYFARLDAGTVHATTKLVVF